MLIVAHVKPNAKTTKIVKQIDEKTFIVALHAPATDGQANEELVRFLAQYLNLPKTSITIKRGHRGKTKYLDIPT